MSQSYPSRRQRLMRSALPAGLIGLVAAACTGEAAQTQTSDAAAQPAPSVELALPTFAPRQDRLPQDEIIYFVLPDRFENGDPTNDTAGIPGDKFDHGFDPTHRGFYNGGDLKGLTERLDYIQGLGVTAIWFAPVFENQPVQDVGENASAGYHGYWITDFLNVDPHFGTRDEFKAFIDAAHARDMKVYMDIITNHTADIIRNAECPASACEYREIADYPWTTVGGPDGAPINEGFLGDDAPHLTAENFAKLTEQTYAYTPTVPEGLENVKNPAWLNDLRYYSHRGESEWYGESAVYGDFSGLDDLLAHHPDVIAGFIDIYSQWISDFNVDGFRIDTVKHVRPEFWQAWTPAIAAHAEAEGIENFHMFAEVYEFEPAHLAKWTQIAKLPSVLDFAFQGAVRAMVAEGKGSEAVERWFEADSAYGPGVAMHNPTFLGNHDMGRFSMFVKEANPEISDADLFKRVALGNAIMFTSRGAPTVYYGDEQGFVSDGNDQMARETLFPSQVAEYNDNDLIATDATTAQDNFDTAHPLYVLTAEMARVRRDTPALRRGQQVARFSEADGGLLAYSRIDEETGQEVVAVFNADVEPRALNVTVDGRSQAFDTLLGACAASVQATNSYRVELEPLSFAVCKADW